MADFTKRVLSSIILFPLSLYFIHADSTQLLFFTIFCFIISFLEWYKMVKSINYKIIGFIFLFFSFYAFYELAIEKIILIPLFICILTDLGGYIFGKIFKGPKLTKISPNKTYTGTIGSFFLSIVFISLYFNYLNYEITIRWIVIIILMSVVSQIGDITISYFKRLSNIKDTGNIIPGHGGLLDRIDGMIFVFPIYYLIQLSGF